MKFTNKWGIPDIVVRAGIAQNAKYDRGPVKRSATQLIQPPRIDILRKAHFHEMEKDISDEWWSLFGSAVHHILEMGANENEVTEQRFFATVNGWPISGQFDLLTHLGGLDVSLVDHKVTTAFVVMKDEDGVKPEWEQQLNINAYLVRKNTDYNIRELSILAIIRDWQRSKAEVDPLYPAAPVMKLRMPLWTFEEQEAFVSGRVAAHRHAEMLMDLDQTLPECSEYDRWVRENKWAVIKKGGKRASKLCDSEEEAIKVSEEKGKDYVVQHRPGESVRCKGDYCGVAKWCEQWQQIKAGQNNGASEMDGADSPDAANDGGARG